MGTVIVPPDQKEVIKNLTPPVVYDMIDRPDVITLVELDSYTEPCGVMVFLVSDEDGAPAAKIEYLYIDLEYRGQGIATDLLRSVEDILFMSGVKKLSVDLSGEDSDIGTFLENYGFLFTCSESEVYISLSPDIPEDGGKYGAYFHSIRPMSDMMTREIESFISSKNEFESKQARELIYSCDKRLSCIYPGDENGWGILLADYEALRPEVTLFYASGSHAKQIKEILAAFFALNIINSDLNEEYIRLDVEGTLPFLQKSFYKYYKEVDVFTGVIDVEAADNT